MSADDALTDLQGQIERDLSFARRAVAALPEDEYWLGREEALRDALAWLEAARHPAGPGQRVAPPWEEWG